MTDLLEQAEKLFAYGKGLLAADESTTTADTKRLALYGIPTGSEMRRQFRDLFLAAPGIEEYLSGVILYEETLEQKSDDGAPFAALLAKRGIMPGIKVDEGTEPFPECKDELITKGLIGLPERLAHFKKTYDTGFTKWRAVVTIKGDRLPTAHALVENAKRLAIYASEAQKTGMVPIVEPEVLLDGNHSRLRAREVITKTMNALIGALEDHAVDLQSVVIKTAMAVSGKESGHQDTPEEVAEDTLGALMDSVPIAIPGIVFLSGGQTPDQATENLRAITKRAKELQAPWPLTFSYARALQEEALAVWAGKPENVPAARAAFLERLKKVSDAVR
ncbi:MAG: fructose-bisphosphate aldolase class I [Candidatus Pacebacteria bacterium]|nr:fructose-bisphosphate aldolase class I [Candidatus Paceibacterota bacterium]